ncbi:MAG: IS1 family transposase [Acidobacteria bacterium]|nr:IS1 family transposase [Acidobacteriota bacterium]
MNCQACGFKTKKYGKDRNGHQRFRCLSCKKTFIEEYERPLGTMRLPIEKAITVINLLVEGCSIRSVERITGVEKRTILSLLALVGDRCEQLMLEKIHNLEVENVQCDELWGYVGMKEKTKTHKEIDSRRVGDAYCFVGMERKKKLILAWHLGRRSSADTFDFTEKLRNATKGNFQVNTDGFKPYIEAMEWSFGADIDFAQIIKHYEHDPEGEKRYSPSRCTGCSKQKVAGKPDLKKASTSHIERQNLTIRMSMRRMTRLTNAFSKKWLNLKAAYALHFAYYNFCRIHKTLRVTPAMEAGITNHVWTIQEIIGN